MDAIAALIPSSSSDSSGSISSSPSSSLGADDATLSSGMGSLATTSLDLPLPLDFGERGVKTGVEALELDAAALIGRSILLR